MKRALLRSVAILACTAWATGAAAAEKPGDQPPAKDFAATLDGEIARAHDLRVKGSFDAAAKVLSQLMLVVPDNAAVIGEYGKVLAQEGRSSDAVPFLERAVQLQPNDWTLYSALGVAYDEANAHNKALAAYQHALTLKPGSPDVFNNMAVSRMQAGDLDGAQRYLEQAQEAGADNPKIAHNLALLASMRPAPKSPPPSLAAAPVRTPSQAPTAPVLAAATPRSLQPSSPRMAVSTASHAPAMIAPTRIATSAPKPLVIMQKVPVDPLAGPVAHRAAEKHMAAAARPHKTKLAAAKLREPQPSASRPPTLRTAADGQ